MQGALHIYAHIYIIAIYPYGSMTSPYEMCEKGLVLTFSTYTGSQVRLTREECIAVLPILVRMLQNSKARLLEVRRCIA
jgi:hypothetical protein